MSLDLSKPLPVATPRPAMPLGFRLGVVALIVIAVLGVAKAWESGYGPDRLWRARPQALDTVEVERGDLAVYVRETGTLESAANTTIRCQVEALIGLVGGNTTKGQGGQGGGNSGGQSGSSQGGGAPAVAPPSGGSSSGGSAAGKSGGGSSKSNSKSSSKSGSSKKKTGGGSGGGGGSSGGSSGSSGSGGSSGGGSSGGGGGMGGGGGGGGGGGSSGGSSGGGSGGQSGGGTQAPVAKKPTIRSFTMTVASYQPLRPATKAGGGSATGGAQTKMGGGGGGGGGNRGGGGGGGNRGGGGGGGGGGGPGGMTEMAGSTRIISIKPEGEPVSAGEVVCELDSAAYKDEVIAQRIRFDQAKAWLIQAKSILEVNDISLREYRDGIYPQDLQLVRQYLGQCRKEEDRARGNLEWSRDVYLKGFRAPTQYQADVLALERAKIALSEAEMMEKRLVNYTGPKLIKSLEAKLEANRADLLAQTSAFQIESDRLKRLEQTVEHCTLRAPHEGIVVYSLPPNNGWRPPTAVIMEGATVRQGQPIFELPDAKKMRVRARVNESKVGSVHVGQKASIRVDAFPDHDLGGTVTSVTAIPAPNGMGSDIRIYFATVAIDSGGFEGLRPGLSAEVSFFVDSKLEATRVPLQAVRWVDTTPYAAVTTAPDQGTYRWQAVRVGLINESFAEILDGLSPGDKVVANPEGLPAPSPTTPPVVQAAGGLDRPRG